MTAAQLGQSDKHQAVEQKVMGSNPSQTNTQVLKITKENVLPLL